MTKKGQIRQRPFKKLRALSRPEPQSHSKEPEPPPDPPEPQRFRDVAEEDGVARSVAAGRVKPPTETKRVAPPCEPVAHAFSVIVDEGRGVEGRRDDVDDSAIAWLIRHDPVATLDLHGSTVEQARRRVHRFIHARAARGDAIVLIVSGRGSGGLHPKGRGVIHDELPEWLTEPPAAGVVRAFTTAPRVHGGHGALLVLLALSRAGDSAR